jgi:hypothetical protein
MTATSRRFFVYTDDGREFQAIEIQHYQRTAPLSEEPELIPTTREFKLADGRHLNYIDDNTFQIVGYEATKKLIEQVAALERGRSSLEP